MDEIIVISVNAASHAAIRLMDELSAELEAKYGDDGRSSFTTSQIDPDIVVYAVAYLKSEPIGCGALRRVDGETAEIKRMFAKSSRLGIGTKILCFLEDEAAKCGFQRLILSTRKTNIGALKFYRQNGYIICKN